MAVVASLLFGSSVSVLSAHLVAESGLGPMLEKEVADVGEVLIDSLDALDRIERMHACAAPWSFIANVPDFIICTTVVIGATHNAGRGRIK